MYEDDPAGNEDELLQAFTVNERNEYYDFWQRADALYDVQHAVW